MKEAAATPDYPSMQSSVAVEGRTSQLPVCMQRAGLFLLSIVHCVCVARYGAWMLVGYAIA